MKLLRNQPTLARGLLEFDYLTTVEYSVPAVGAGGTAVISHDFSLVAGVELIDQSTGRRVLADWFQVGADPSADVSIDFTNAVSVGDYTVRIFGNPLDTATGPPVNTNTLDFINNNANAWWAANDIVDGSQTWTDRINSYTAQLGSASGVDADDPNYDAGPPQHYDFDSGDFFVVNYGDFAGINAELDNEAGSLTIIMRGYYPSQGGQGNLLTMWQAADDSRQFEIYNRRTSLDFTMSTFTDNGTRDTIRHPAGTYSAGDSFVIVCGYNGGTGYMMTDQSTDPNNTIYQSVGGTQHGLFGIDTFRMGVSETGANPYRGSISDLIVMHGVDPSTVDVAAMASFLDSANYT